jgi:plasmid maintenance system antidote protein VapI
MKKHQTMTAVLLRTIKESGQSLYSIAKATGMQKTALGRFVAGKQSLRLDLADRLAVHFDLELKPRKSGKSKVNQ